MAHPPSMLITPLWKTVQHKMVDALRSISRRAHTPLTGAVVVAAIMPMMALEILAIHKPQLYYYVAWTFQAHQI